MIRKKLYGSLEKDGTIEVCENGDVLVRAHGDPWCKGQPGVTVENPQDDESRHIYRKVFNHPDKKIFMPDAYDHAVGLYLGGPNSIVFSMNGYSEIDKDMQERYLFSPDDYVAANAALMRECINHVRKMYQAAGTGIRLVHGASAVGVDLAQRNVAEEFNIIPLGFSCPKYMLFVPDDNKPVYVSATVPEYHHNYIRSIHVLFCTGGRKGALTMDIMAACEYENVIEVHFVDLASHLSQAGPVPATVPAGNGKREVNNAPAVFGSKVSFFNKDTDRAGMLPGQTIWDAIFNRAKTVCANAYVHRLDAKYKFTRPS